MNLFKTALIPSNLLAPIEPPPLSRVSILPSLLKPLSTYLLCAIFSISLPTAPWRTFYRNHLPSPFSPVFFTFPQASFTPLNPSSISSAFFSLPSPFLHFQRRPPSQRPTFFRSFFQISRTLQVRDSLFSTLSTPPRGRVQPGQWCFDERKWDSVDVIRGGVLAWFLG